MEILFSFLFWAGITFLMMHRGRSSHLAGQERLRLRNPVGPNKGDGLELRWVPPPKDVDPACGKTVTTDKAKPSVYAGNVYYFCSRECREVFEAAPAFYVGKSGPPTAGQQAGAAGGVYEADPVR